MKISTIYAKNFLSFNNFELLDLNAKLNFIVGANGAGKSNVFEISKILINALYNQVDFNSLIELVNVNSKDKWFEFGLGIEFSSQDEKEMLTNFFYSCLINEQLISLMQDNFQQKQLLEGKHVVFTQKDMSNLYRSYLGNQFSSDDLIPFFKGSLILRVYNGANPSTLLYYSVKIDGKDLYFFLNHSLFSSKLPNEPIDSYSSLSLSNLFMNESPLDVLKGDNRNISILNMIRDVTKSGDLVNASGTARFNDDFAHQLNISSNSNEQILLINVFRHIFNSSIFYLENFRSKPLRRFYLNELSDSNISIGNGEKLALFLIQLKNGNEKQRKQYIQFQHIFYVLTNEHINVRLTHITPKSI